MIRRVPSIGTMSPLMLRFSRPGALSVADLIWKSGRISVSNPVESSAKVGRARVALGESR